MKDGDNYTYIGNDVGYGVKQYGLVCKYLKMTLVTGSCNSLFLCRKGMFDHTCTKGQKYLWPNLVLFTVYF